MLKENTTLRGTKMTIVIHKTKASKLAHEVSKLSVKEVWEFVDTLKTYENVGNYTYSGVKQRIRFNEFLEEDNA